MKYSLTVATILAMAGATYSQAEDVLPPQYNFDRYSKMVDQSPFAVASAVAAPAATPDFAKDLYIANAAKSQDGDMVTIASTQITTSKNILPQRNRWTVTASPTSNGPTKWAQTKVTISKDGNFATLTFNQALLSQASPGGGVAARALPAPAMPVPNPAGVPNAHAPKLPAERATGITTVDSFAGLDAAAYAWHDSTESKNKQGSRAGLMQARSSSL